MRLALRILIRFLNVADEQMNQIDNELRGHDEFRRRAQLAAKELRFAIRSFVSLYDDLGDSGIE